MGPNHQQRLSICCVLQMVSMYFVTYIYIAFHLLFCSILVLSVLSGLTLMELLQILYSWRSDYYSHSGWDLLLRPFILRAVSVLSFPSMIETALILSLPLHIYIKSLCRILSMPFLFTCTDSVVQALFCAHMACKFSTARLIWAKHLRSENILKNAWFP